MSRKTTTASDTLATHRVLARSYPGVRGALKREILAGALDCFNESGLEASTIEMIRTRCDTSVGAIYHHFKSKEGLAAALFFAALDDQHALADKQFKGLDDQTLERRIAVLVCSYMQWVSKQPQLARFLFQARSYVSKGPQGDELTQKNREYFAPIVAWLTEGVKHGSLRALPREAYAPLIMGPAESYCKTWLAGRAATRPHRLAAEFARAAWRSVAMDTAT